MVLQLPARGIERIADRDAQLLMRMVLAELAPDDHRAAGHRQIHTHLVDIALPMAAVGGVQHHPARDNPVTELVELCHQATQLGVRGADESMLWKVICTVAGIMASWLLVAQDNAS